MYPGKITREYNENMRARYTPPIRLYVFISLIYFVLIQISTTNNTNVNILKLDEPQLQDSIVDKNLSPETIRDSISGTLQDSIEFDNIFGLVFKMKRVDIPKYKEATAYQIDSLILENKMTPNYFSRTIYRQLIKSINSDADFNKRLLEK